MGRFFLVCLGGAFGTGARFLIGSWTVKTLGTGFPWGTLFINVLGSFLIVIILGSGLERAGISADLRLVLATGVMGGFTTYSSFNFESLRLFQHGSLGLGLTYMAATVFGCLLAGGLGQLLAR
ncbi:MAG TPA: CrcB family protein [Polyangia bacterium]|jgi:CrcB protein